MTRAAQSRRVFFWEEPIWSEQATEGQATLTPYAEISREGENLWVVRAHLQTGVNAEKAQRDLLQDLLRDMRIFRYDAWFYTPMATAFTSFLQPEVTVYDCMDELSHFQGAPPELVTREKELFRRANVVFTGGISLYESKRSQHASVFAFPSSIDREHFASAQGSGLAEPEEQKGIPHPRAGFYGVVDERFDVALLGALAQLRPGVHFVILGPVVKIDPATLPQAENIHYLGAQSYQNLPAFLSGWDVALLLFALNDATKYISPTKTPEYLAAGKTVVSTPILDVVRSYGNEGLVRIASSAEDFARELDGALAEQPERWRAAVDAKLSESSWDQTWREMSAEMERVRTSDEEPIAESADLSATHTAASAVSALRIDLPRRYAPSGVRPNADRYDWLVVGAGFAGSVMAERLASETGKRVLVIDKRTHIAGNAYDYLDEAGVLVHKYGPHIFHTNSEAVFTYLSCFTTWRPYEHRVLASVDAQLLPIPINLDTVNRLYNLNLDAAGMEAFLAARAESPVHLRTSEDIVVSRVGRELYEKFFRNYTRKQWGLDPSQLDAAVAGRIPVRTNRDDRYFSDIYQFMPEHGYTRMFERMLDHPRISVRLGVEYSDIIKSYPRAKIVFTGPIDEYYGFRYGALPYRSLEFRHETHDREQFQTAPVVNYPNEHPYTRVTEFKYLTGQVHPKTSVVYEYPRSEGDPYYPIPRAENAILFARYRELAEKDGNVTFCGRLANYKYFNMDQVVAQALQTFKRLNERQEVMSLVHSSPADFLPTTQRLAEHGGEIRPSITALAAPKT